MSSDSYNIIFTEKDFEIIDVDNILKKVKDLLVKFKNVNTDAIRKLEKKYQYFLNKSNKLLSVEFKLVDSFLTNQITGLNRLGKVRKITEKNLKIGDKILRLLDENTKTDYSKDAYYRKKIKKLELEQEKLSKKEKQYSDIAIKSFGSEEDVKLITSKNIEFTELLVPLFAKSDEIIVYKFGVEWSFDEINHIQKQYFLNVSLLTVFIFLVVTTISSCAELGFIRLFCIKESFINSLIVSLLIGSIFTFFIEKRVDKKFLKPRKINLIKRAMRIANLIVSSSKVSIRPSTS